MALFKSESDLCDVVSVAVFCANDNTMMLTVDNTNEHWIPSVGVPAGQSWFKAISKEIQDIFGAHHPNKILRLWKTWLPRHTLSHLVHCVFATIVDSAGKNKSKTLMGKYRGKLRWVSEGDIIKLSSSYGLKSPELVELFFLMKQTPPPTYPLPDDFIFRNNFAESSDEILISGKGNPFCQLVEASGIDKLAQESLLKQFILMCFPTNYMGCKAFTKFVCELGWHKENAPSLFRAADLNNRNGVSFREMLYLLAAVDPSTVHGGPAAEIRCKYMFKYYDRDKDDLLRPEEVKTIIMDLRRVKKQSLDANSVSNDFADLYKAIGISDQTSINLMTFLKSISELKLRGTSTLFRSSVGILKYLKNIEDRGGGGGGVGGIGNWKHTVRHRGLPNYYE